MVNASAIVTQQKLAETADRAVALTRDGPLDQATTAQQATVTTLAMIIHSLSSDEKIIEQLKDLSTTLGQLIDQQNNLSTSMANQRGRNLTYEIQKRQIDTSDQSGASSAQLMALNSHAAGLVHDGQASMEKVVSIINQQGRQDREAIPPAQQVAVSDLDAAKKEIDQQVALLTNDKALSLADLITDIEDLLRLVQQAAIDQHATATAVATPNSPFMPTAAALKTFHDRVDALQQKALPISPEAAGAIGDSSQHLTAAASAAQQPAMAAAHLLAAQDLDKAVAILLKQLSALQADEEKEKQIDAALAKLDAADKKTDEALADMKKDDTTPQAVAPLTDAKTDVADAQTDATAADVPAAATPLDNAVQAETTAQTAATAQQVPPATAAALAAKADIADAKKALNAEKAALAAAADPAAR